MRKPFLNSGKVLKEIRSDLGLTQREMGRILDMHVQFVSNSERGMSFVPPRAFNLIITKLVARKKRDLIGKLKKSIKDDLYTDFVTNKLEAKNVKTLA